jgi:hypothetical protein
MTTSRGHWGQTYLNIRQNDFIDTLQGKKSRREPYNRTGFRKIRPSDNNTLRETGQVQSGGLQTAIQGIQVNTVCEQFLFAGTVKMS